MSVDEFRRFFGQNLKEIRKIKGFSQYAFSIEADISLPHLQAIEGGARFPSCAMLLKLATALGIEPFMLFYPRKKEQENANFSAD